MQFSTRRRAEVFCLASALLAAAPFSGRAFAQSQPAPHVELAPPELLQQVEPVYPEAALRERLEAAVGLRLTIAVDGRVSEAEVTDPAGHGFDEAARQAALGFSFAPGRRGGQPVQARIRYSFVFKLPVEPAVAEPAASVSAPGAPAPLAPEVAPAVLAAAVAPAVPAEPPPVDVRVRGRLSEAEQLQQSAEAVNVVELRRAKQETADMAEVLARTQGIAVRRDGGLGSPARFALNGLYDDQVRFFLDGVPLEFSGFPFGIENVPVNLLERVEIFRGVVPIRFGADALGGAVNLVTEHSYRNRLAASYQVGAFGTHRLTLEGRYRDERTGLFVGALAFADRAKNNYSVDVEIPDDRGRLSPATVKRFHDGYTAAGASIEVGVLDRTWAKRLSLRGFYSGYDKQLQNNVVMTVPYGEVRYAERVIGATATYEVNLRSNVALELVANYSHRSIDFVDDSSWVYNWLGQRIRARRENGEITSDAIAQTIWQGSAFNRALIKWEVARHHAVRASVSPVLTTRTGKDHLLSASATRDPLTAQRDLFTVVSGIEYEVNLLDDRLSQIFFVKDYLYRAEAEDTLPGGIFRKRDSQSHTQGIGDSVRFRITPWLLAKASYEFATRLPTPFEVFGNGILIQPNLDLRPETSHNGNLGPRFELRRTALGDFTLDINAFIRDTHDKIVLLGDDRNFTYQNVYRSRGLGIENAASFTDASRFVRVDGMFTYEDTRNASTQGSFKAFDGDRLPNRPYLFASWAARLRFANLPGPDDTVEPYYNGRYVHEFYRGWESQGLRAFKQVVDAQLTHNVGVSWTVNSKAARVTSTFEVANVTDAKVFDNFGVQRPGRAAYLKLSGEM